jgi:uncharacterized protein (TIGR02145 family)
MLNDNNTNTDYKDITNKPDLSIYATKNMANQNITNLANPVNPLDAATKAYVDALLKRIEVLELENLPAGSFTDERDGNQYKFVKIGNQIWMAENLKYMPDVVGFNKWSITEPYYYVNEYNGTNVNEAKSTVSYNNFGVLYNWPAATNGAPESNSNPSGVQGVCPSGWHLPSRDEWEQFIDYLGGDNVAGGKLKETGTKHWKSPNTDATNESGFTALPGGGFIEFSGFEYGAIGFTSWLMSATDFLTIAISNTQGSIDLISWNDSTNFKAFGLSVRCVKD